MNEKNIFAVDKEISKQIKNLNISLGRYDKSNKRLTVILLLVALLQLFIGIFQCATPFFVTPGKEWLGVFIAVAFFLAVFYAIKQLEKDFFDKKDGKNKKL